MDVQPVNRSFDSIGKNSFSGRYTSQFMHVVGCLCRKSKSKYWMHIVCAALHCCIDYYYYRTEISHIEIDELAHKIM